MEKIYLVGILYDDFEDCGFDVKGVASTKEKARFMKDYLIHEGWEKSDVEVREWDIDIFNPIVEMKKVEGEIGSYGKKVLTTNIVKIFHYKTITFDE